MYFLCLFPLLLVTLISTLSAKQIHLFLAADTYSNLESSAKIDIKRIKNELRSVAEQLCIDISIQEMHGKRLTEDKLKDCIKNTCTSQDDILVFYYSGHGFRYKSSNSIWPHLYFTPLDESLHLEEVVQCIVKKPGTLYFILADCCNNIPKHLTLPYHPFQQEFTSKGKLNKKTYSQLFSAVNTLIVASGSSPGKVAWATEKGSLFTLALLRSVKEETLHENPDWSRIFERTISLCKKHQQPQYSIMQLESIRRH